MKLYYNLTKTIFLYSRSNKKALLTRANCFNKKVQIPLYNRINRQHSIKIKIKLNMINLINLFCKTKTNKTLHTLLKIPIRARMFSGRTFSLLLMMDFLIEMFQVRNKMF